jgi:hypothetical protein
MTAIGRQALTVLLPVRSGREPALEAALASVGPVLGERLHGATRLHFARLAVVPSMPAEGKGSAAFLLFETTYDGDFEAHVAELFGSAGAELSGLLAECDGVGPGGGLAEFEATLRRRARHSWVFAAAHGGFGVEDIRRDAALREGIAELLARDRAVLATCGPLEILRSVRRELAGRFSGAPLGIRSISAEAREDALFRSIRAIPLVLRMLFHDVREHVLALWHDRPALDWSAGATRQWSAERLPQRGFTHVALVKPGRFRRSALRRALALVASFFGERALEGEPPGVHALRFVLLDDGRLLFTDQHDGSLASRVFALSRRARVLFSLVWTNTEGYPRALFRHLLGKTDDEALLDWLRTRELSGFCYSAYPTLTARDVRVNAEIRELFELEPTEGRARRLLELV